jgi:TRAP-type C4-dicarboxylate transport system substrate-binding protein
LPWSEVYYALSAGLLDGTKNSVQDIVGMKLNEHLHYLLADRHAYMGALWWYSQRNWLALPDDLKPAVSAGFRALAKATREAAAAREAPALAAFRASGGVVEVATPSQRDEFRRATQGVRAWYIKRYGPEWLDRFEVAVRDCETQAGATG